MSEDNKPKKDSIAVALQYEHGKDAAPRVTAKGRGTVAEKIVEKAREHGVAIENNEVLAKALSQVELDQQIPGELYRAVAEVIVFVMRHATPKSPR